MACRRGDLEGNGNADGVPGRSPRRPGRSETALFQDSCEGSSFVAAPEKEVEGFSEVRQRLLAGQALGANIEQGARGDVEVAVALDFDGQLGLDVDGVGSGHLKRYLPSFKDNRKARLLQGRSRRLRVASESPARNAGELRQLVHTEPVFSAKCSQHGCQLVEVEG